MRIMSKFLEPCYAVLQPCVLKAGAHDDCCHSCEMLTIQSISQERLQSS